MNRVAFIASIAIALGFFFLPIVELKPNRLAAGVPFSLLQFQNDFRYLVLFVLSLVPAGLAYIEDRSRRGSLLLLIGYVLLTLVLLLPTIAGNDLLANAANYFDETIRLRNPRLLPTSALTVGFIGSLMVLYAAFEDLRASRWSFNVRLLLGSIGFLILVGLFASHAMDTYSVMVEFQANGALLGQRIIEHVVMVAVALLVGLIAGVALGLWATRDQNASPFILYSVSIIQTIPSLALFGLLLVPLARLGDLPLSTLLTFFLITGLLIVFTYAIFRVTGLPLLIRRGAMLVFILSASIALTLFTVVLVSFGFRVILQVAKEGNAENLQQLLIAVLIAPILFVFSRQPLRKMFRRLLAIGALIASLIAIVISLVMVVQAAQSIFARVPASQSFSVRDLGISGIGTAPALVALALYSLLPIVRNTFAGLNNVDRAVIDAGRGMGMTARQIFFRIELPLALPVIMAGVRNAGVALVGIAVIATLIGAGGLGDFVVQGIVTTSVDMVLLGSIPAIALSFLVDLGLRMVEVWLTSPGLRTAQSSAK